MALQMPSKDFWTENVRQARPNITDRTAELIRDELMIRGTSHRNRRHQQNNLKKGAAAACAKQKRKRSRFVV